ncbi:MAG: starch synthase [Mariniblastus sp.]|jgi:starch synthase
MLHHLTNDESNLRIVIAASEAVPWSKTGGLADVSTALAKSHAANGHDVSLIIPYHRQTKFAQQHTHEIHDTGVTLSIPMGPKLVQGRVFWTQLPGSNVRVLLIDQPDYFHRPGLYQESNRDYGDNCERFVFFSRAVLEACRSFVLRPDIIHANDWQTGLVPALLKLERAGTPGFEQTASVFTIHNLLFQGWFSSQAMNLTGLNWRHFNWREMECHDQLNLLKTGLTFSDQLTTVSPTYAREIQTPEYGCGLEGLLRHRQHDLTGILNGIDLDEWSPRVDPNLARNFDADSFREGKPICKTDLQRKLGLPENAGVPLFGMVSRMTDQKGFDLIANQAQTLLEQDIQMVFLGSGDERYESVFGELARKYPTKVATKIGFDETLAHQIEAGSDFYLMPSQFEPCGLNQMYSLAYGTVPLVRAVGGLADSVVDTNPASIESKTATGIVFHDYHPGAFADGFNRCLSLFRNTNLFNQVRETGMRRDWSWLQSADKYVDVYRRAILAGSPVAH